MGQVAVMRNGLRESARELQKIREQLIELKRTVPSQEPVDQDAGRDLLMEMVATIDCGLRDSLEPLIEDLLDAATREV
jgi:hypothetical protein